MKILVVEDETAIADFVQRGLEAEGYAVDCAGDGLEGERQALEGKPDLVVLDLMLPGRDGISVLGKIRETKPTLPVIVLTARDTVEDKVAGLDSGATDYVTKPFSFDELTAASGRTCATRASSARPRSSTQPASTSTCSPAR